MLKAEPGLNARPALNLMKNSVAHEVENELCKLIFVHA